MTFDNPAPADNDHAAVENAATPTLTSFQRALIACGIDPALADLGFRAPHPFPVAVLLGMRGIRVMPSKVKTKIPCIKGWPDDASADPRAVARFQQQFQPNFSILTGRTNGIIVLDIDGERGHNDLQALETKFGPIPKTWRCNSGRVGGGYHLWLACPPGDDDLRNQQPIPGTKIDVRGWHGHVVIAGSLHKSGLRYTWADGCAPDEVELAECPAAWWEFLPKRIETGARSRPIGIRMSGRSGSPKVAHDPTSLRIGDGDGYGGFQNPIYKCALKYFIEAGIGAPEEPILIGLRALIEAAPKAEGRDVSRYMEGPELPRQIERAREFVKAVRHG